MKEIKPDRTICLMDIADDWRQQFNLDLYIQTYDAAIDFACNLWGYDADAYRAEMSLL